jgi:hypothetical protein
MPPFFISQRRYPRTVPIPKSLRELRRLPHISVSQLKAFIQCPRKWSLA